MSTLGQRVITTRSGVRIGSAYVPKPPQPSADAATIQAALLEPRTTQPLTGWRRVVGFLWSRA